MEFSENELTEILNIFQIEAEEIISKTNNSLLDLERNPKNKELILVLFRNAHSLKGASRMIGFNAIQSLAHKMEDILDLAKENKLLLNTKISDILYKTVDIISDIVKNSIEAGKEIANPDIVNEQLAILDNIKSTEEQNIIETKETLEINRNLLKSSTDKIDSLIINTLICLMKLEEKCAEDMIDRLSNYINKLFDLFNEIGFFEIKINIENIKIKLDIVKQASYNLTTRELIEIQDNISTVINILSTTYEMNNIQLVDYYSYAFDKISTQSDEEFILTKTTNEEQTYKNQQEICTEEISIETENFQNLINFKNIKDNINNLQTDITDIYEIREFFEQLKKTCENDNASKMISEIIKILKISEKENTCPNKQVKTILLEATTYLDELLNNNNDIGNFDLLFQQLEIILQLLDLNSGNEKSETLDLSQIQSVQSKTRNTTSDFSKIFSTNEIKTLHIDSNKLDILINKLDEILTTKTKSSKKIIGFYDILIEMEDFQKDFLRKINIIKTLDKKIDINSNNLSTYLKQTSNVFMEDYQKLTDILNEIKNIQRFLQDNDSKLNFLVDDLSSMVKDIRVLPFATVFHFFGRMVRDIAKEKNKKIELSINGSDTTADKNIIEEIKNPLIHIVRNAIDHGIETPEKRIALGKNPTGKISISARQENNKVILEVYDDGQGFNLDKIKETAIIKEFVTQEELNMMNDTEIMNMIFWPGFTTDDKVTDISGRGIGLDVVKSKMLQLNGQIKISTEMNKFSCMTLELPLTISTINAFIVKSANKIFALPVSTIDTVISKPTEEIHSTENQTTILYKERTIPVYNLTNILNLDVNEENSSNYRTIMIIHADNKIIGLMVDKLIGMQEILHKKLAPPIQKLKNIAGVSTLVSGETCLILNVSDVVKTALFQSNKLLMWDKIRFIENKTKNKILDKKILVIDDSIIVRTLTKNILSYEGFNVETAYNPIEAFEKLNQTQFDIIITDLEMPEMDGIDFLIKLKEDKIKSKIPILVMSSDENQETKDKVKNLGAIDYIQKNEFKQPEFLKKLKDIIIQQN